MAKAKARRRGPKGQGTVYRNASGGWTAKRPVGRKGNRTVYLERKGRTQAEAIERLKAALPPAPTTTLREWAERWTGESRKRPGTMASRRVALDEHILPALGAVRLADLTTRAVEVAAAGWAASLKPGTVRLTLSVLHTCLEAARKARAVAENPVSLAARPRAARKEPSPFTPAEVLAIIGEAERRPHTRLFALLAATGMRGGEVLALRADEFDPAAGSVAVRRTRARDKRHADGPPKSANGERVVEVPAVALPAVRAAHAGRRSGPLFPTKDGTFPQYGTAFRAWRGLLARAGVPYRNPHQLRHAAATTLLGSGMGVADVAKHLGDSPETVMRTYCHPTGASAAAVLDRVFAEAAARRPVPATASEVVVS